MDKEIKKYRKTHHKCKGCKYYRYHSPSLKVFAINCADYEECILKDKIIHFTNKRNLCLHYEPEEEKTTMKKEIIGHKKLSKEDFIYTCPECGEPSLRYEYIPKVFSHSYRKYECNNCGCIGKVEMPG